MMEELFNKLLFVSLRSSSREERRARLRISILIIHPQSTRGKELSVRLTDDEDPFFLFTLQLGEDDFQILKSQQGLLVDFASFPQNLMDLLNYCIDEEAKDFPKFLLTFTISDHDCGVSYLNVVETNSFKHLTHLSLKFILGNDVDVKKYLATCLTSLKDENKVLKKQLESTETELGGRLARAQEALASRNKELSELREEFNVKSSSIITQHSLELATEKEKTIQIQASCQKRCDEEKKQLESSHRAILVELQNKISKLTITNNELSEAKFRCDATCADLKTKLTFSEEAYQRCKVEVTKLRRDNTNLDSERHERDKTLNHLRTRIAVLEQENKDNQEVISRTRELLEAANEQRKKCEETVAERQQQLNKSERTVQSISDELVKGNEIILRIQKELRNSKAKNKLNATVIAQQEKVVTEKTSTMEKQNEELRTLMGEVKKKDAEIDTLKESLSTANEKLEENKQMLKTNENVINWLNKQINEQYQSKFGPASVNSLSSHIGARSNFNNLALPHSTPLSVDSVSNSTNAHIPRNPMSHAQVVYRPGYKAAQITPSIPEESAKTSPQILSGPLKMGKENNPLIDPKYLTKPNQKMCQSRPAPLQTHNKKNDSNNPIISSNVQPGIPLMSAYFPKNTSANQ